MAPFPSERRFGAPISNSRGRGPSLASDAAPGLQVLVADDSSTNRRLLEMMLKRMGHEPVLAGDGLEAVEAFERGSFDLVLLDCRMPRMDGPSAACAMRAIEARTRRERTSIVAVTGGLSLAEIATCRESGMDGVLDKPFGLRDLEAVVRAGRPAA